MHKIYRRVFLILLAGILALAAISFGLSASKIHRIEQLLHETLQRIDEIENTSDGNSILKGEK